MKESSLDGGVNPADMRMTRPPQYSPEQEWQLLRQLQNPKNRDAIAKVLSAHPEMAAKLQHMLHQAIMSGSGIDYYKMTGDTYHNLDNAAAQKAGSMVQGLK